jgi:gamma-glutamylcyclotransferase (GGCT)/AIG2-like uncharacterized protein YtfP
MKQLNDISLGPGYRLFFFYGTLRSFAHNNHRLNNCVHVAPAITKEKYVLSYNVNSLIPYAGVVFTGNHPTSQIVGELYLVPPSEIERLDLMEGHPDYYERRLTETLGKIRMNGRIEYCTQKAWMYHFDRATIKPSERVILSGDYSDVYPVEQ